MLHTEMPQHISATVHLMMSLLLTFIFFTDCSCKIQKKKKVSFFSACFLFILFSCNYPAFPKNTHHLYIFWVFFYFFFSEFRWTTVLTQKIFKSKMFFPSLIKHFKWGYFLILTTDYPHLNFWLLSPRFMIFITSISLNFFPVHFTIEHFSYIWFSYYWLLR